jgi:hypothetical protein
MGEDGRTYSGWIAVILNLRRISITPDPLACETLRPEPRHPEPVKDLHSVIRLSPPAKRKIVFSGKEELPSALP